MRLRSWLPGLPVALLVAIALVQLLTPVTPVTAQSASPVRVQGTDTNGRNVPVSVTGTKLDVQAAGTVALDQTTTANDVDVTSVVPGTGTTNLAKAEDSASATGHPLVPTACVRQEGTTALSDTAGDYTVCAADSLGVQYARVDHPARFTCHVAVSTATTITAVGGSCVAPGAGLSLYVTDVRFGTSAAAGTAADSFPTLKSGTGGTCGTATAVVWSALTTANSTVVDNMTTPLKLATVHELCWIMTTAGSKTLVVNGFIAP